MPRNFCVWISRFHAQGIDGLLRKLNFLGLDNPHAVREYKTPLFLQILEAIRLGVQEILAIFGESR